MKLESIRILCFLVSLLLHGVLVVAGTRAVSARTEAIPVEHKEPRADSWAGETFDIDTRTESPGEPEREGRSAPPAAAPAAIAPVVPVRLEEHPIPAATATPAPPPAPTPDAVASTKPERVAPLAKPPLSSQPAASSPVAVASAQPMGGGLDAGGSGSFGAAGPARGVRNLATAFARAMPIANTGDPVWGTLPLGPAGSLEVSLEVDDTGKLVGADPSESAHAPEHLVRLVERTLALLRAGRFALTGTEPHAGSETFLLEAEIEQVETTGDEDPSMAGPYALGFAAPRKGEPGHATFTLRTGRRVKIVIKLVAK